MSEGWDRRSAVFAARASFAAIAAWIAIAWATRATGPEAIHAIVDLPFALICHRMPERVPALFGVPAPLCSRCLGLWVGLSLSAAAAWPAIPIKALRIVLPIAAALLLAEVVTQDLGWHPVFHPTRLLSGILVSVPMGGALGALLAQEISGGRPPRS